MAQFKYYLHDDGGSDERIDEFARQIPEIAAMDDAAREELAEKIGRPFYEVTLTCDLDLETGNVTVLGVKL